jgi:hypothetical protein
MIINDDDDMIEDDESWINPLGLLLAYDFPFCFLLPITITLNTRATIK